MRDNRVKYIAAIFLASLVLRIAYVIFVPQIDTSKGDSTYYIGVSKSLVEGHGYALNGKADVLSPPGYPFFMAAIYKIFGIDNMPVRIAQAILGALAVVLVYYLARSIFGERIARISSLIVCVYPGFIGYAGMIYPQLLAMFLLVLFIFLLNLKPNLCLDALLGLIAGYFVLVRPEIVFLVTLLLLITVVVSKVKKQALVRALVIFAILCAIVSLWSVRNYKAFGKIIPISVSGGQTLWISTWHEEWLEWKEAEPVLSLEKIGSQIEVSQAYFNAGIDNMKTHPYIYLKMCAKRLYRLWLTGYSNAFYFMSGSLKDYLINGNYAVAALKLTMLISNILIILAGFFGIALVCRRFPGTTAISYLSLPIFFLIIFHFFFFATPRYTIMVMPFVIIFASVTINYLLTGRRHANV